ncbi:TetR/AcrR family transcriptional regulator [Mycolicibacterium monacense]|uniref:TetR/AcrR family transcriptional regulator n=1 Tax=Mycolicibacterium monacense TaxID=85693 RepID=UPI0009EF6945|nr:hypothetical protein [Mycolicibacterium monacense]
MSSESDAEVTDLTVLRLQRTRAAAATKLLDAAIDLLRDIDGDDLSVDAVARRAGVPETTAAELFPSTDDMIVDICLRRIHDVEVSTCAASGSVARVVAQLNSVISLVAEEPAVAAACASVFLDAGPAASRAREQIGHEIHRLIASAAGPGSWREVRTTLELAFTGALIQAAMGSMPYHAAAERLEDAVNLLLEGAAR